MMMLGFGRGSKAQTQRTTLGRFTTPFATDSEHKTRASNVQLAAEAIDNKTIPAGATFSFNDAVGERTAAFGFAKAVVLRDAMIAEGTGGGTCQVASTLHAAALLAGLDIVLRAPHTRPSAYIRMGLDATVAFPKVDLKIKNPAANPIVVRATTAKKTGQLDVWIEGTERQDVTLTSEIIEVLRFERTIERDAAIDPATIKVRAFGIPGYRVRRVRELHLADGSPRRDVRVDVYPPTTEVVRIAPSFDEALLAGRRLAEANDVLLEAGALRPTLVQLRPSTLVTIDNRPP